MSLEIERKFLVKNTDFKKESYKSSLFKQGYLTTDEHRTVRVRVTDTTAFLTIKGKSNTAGTTRFEWEKEIDFAEGEALLLLCKPNIIEKKRYFVKNGAFVFEVDEFFGNNKGLLLAEIELKNEADTFIKPNWLAEEVTGDEKYYNAYLSKKPYSSW